ncbi:uncharacterized protein LOC141691086 [Apium graveolens]|uniref:uncharacterized protein LOC141691086 n=1 Tax=Apium graveolens TaxID=4045 RepID=UPI003D7B3162
MAEYEAKFTELSGFVPEFVNTEEKKARRFQLATKSFISRNFSNKLNLNVVPLREVLQVEIANREIIPVNQVHHRCKLKLEGKAFEVDLIPFVLGKFNMVIEMDWLSSNGVQIDCKKKKVRIRVQDGKEIMFKGQRKTHKFLTMFQTKNLLKKGNESYLAYVMDTKKEIPDIQDIPVVNEFEDVFPKDLPGFPPDREI